MGMGMGRGENGARSPILLPLGLMYFAHLSSSNSSELFFFSTASETLRKHCLAPPWTGQEAPRDRPCGGDPWGAPAEEFTPPFILFDSQES